jgi:hypothetical protein
MTSAEIVAAAMAHTGLSEMASRHFEPVLAAWVADLDHPRLSARGRAFLTRLVTRNLERRLTLVDHLAKHPEIAAAPLPPIIVIAGFPRTGTTLLHKLMTCRRPMRALLRWELVEPLPPPEAATHASDPRIARAQAAIEPLRGTMLERMHWVDATDPEECPWGFYDCAGLLGRGCLNVMPTWARAVYDGPAQPTLHEHRRLVQLLLSRNPLAKNGALVLKSPMTTPSLPAYARLFPEARFVLVHRDPYRAFVSACTMLEVIGRPLLVDGYDAASDSSAGSRFAFELFRRCADTMIAFSRDNPGRVTHLHYPDLMADPVSATRRVLADLGHAAPAELPAAIAACVAKQRGGHRRAPPSAYRDFGFDASRIWQEPAIAAYVEKLAVQREPTRIVEPTT